MWKERHIAGGFIVEMVDWGCVWQPGELIAYWTSSFNLSDAAAQFIQT